MIRLANKTLELLLHEPEDGFYRGTRFDRSGVAGGISWHGIQLADSWFEHYDPYAHDAVQGPAEEFTPIGFEAAAPGEIFIKPGVGKLLRPDQAPYDRFRLYEISDPGIWSVNSGPDRAEFRHLIPGIYDYRKEIALCGPSCFEIRHRLEAIGDPLSCEVYNHNFWTMGMTAVGPSRLIDFPFAPAGNWRAEYDSVGFTASGVRFSRIIKKGESVYTGDIHIASGTGMPYNMSVADNGVRIHIEGDAPVTRTVLWANHRVACLEPYNDVKTPFSWTVRYTYE